FLGIYKERDEREEYVTGRASKVTYISSLAFLIFLLFLSIFQVEVRKLPVNLERDHKHELNIGLNFSFFDFTKNQDKEVLFAMDKIPLSQPGLILIVLLWLVGTYNVSARKNLKT